MALAKQMLSPIREEDAELIERVAAGDEAAFSALYKRHARHVAGVVYRLLGNDHHLDDVVQDTFVIGLRQIRGLRDPAALRMWLTQIAVRRVKRVLAERYRNRTMAGDLEQICPRATDQEAGAEIHALYRALERLPEKIRIPWMLHHIEGQTLPAVAELCETSLTSVKRHIAAASDRLRRLGHAG